jgi:hypothetical protein
LPEELNFFGVLATAELDDNEESEKSPGLEPSCFPGCSRTGLRAPLIFGTALGASFSSFSDSESVGSSRWVHVGNSTTLVGLVTVTSSVVSITLGVT